MNFIHYIHMQYNFLWILFFLISNAQEIIYIEDFQTFESELERCKLDGDFEFVIKNNITISHQIEINCNDVNIHITSLNTKVYIN